MSSDDHKVKSPAHALHPPRPAWRLDARAEHYPSSRQRAVVAHHPEARYFSITGET
jgi:hypothetical protein